jgi:hypothetical protein
MRRRTFSLTTLLAAAVLGGSTLVAPAQADEAPPPPRKRAPSSQSKSKGEAPPAIRCQNNSECTAGQVCKPVGDHKECQAAPRPMPVPT